MTGNAGRTKYPSGIYFAPDTHSGHCIVFRFKLIRFHNIQSCLAESAVKSARAGKQALHSIISLVKLTDHVHDGHLTVFLYFFHDLFLGNTRSKMFALSGMIYITAAHRAEIPITARDNFLFAFTA